MIAKPVGCMGCPFYGNGRGFAPFWHKGEGVLEAPAEVRLVAIGESLGDQEAAEGQPFVGRSGWALNTALRHAGVDRDEVLVGNTILCQPPVPFDVRNEAWMLAIRHCARAHTQRILDEVKPTSVLLMGGAALLRHTGMRPASADHGGYGLSLNGIEDVRGSVYQGAAMLVNPSIPLRPDVYVSVPLWGNSDPFIVPTLHPAFILRGNQHLKPLLAHDVARWARVGMAQRVGPKPDFSKVALKAEDTQAIVTGMTYNNEVTFDVENDSTGKITMVGLGVAYPQGIVYVTDADDVVKAMMGRKDLMKVGHNIAYDIKMMGGPEVVVPPWFDTIMAAALVQPALPKSLASTASLYGGDHYWYWKDLPDNPRTQAMANKVFGLGPGFHQWDRLYNALDVWWTMQVKRELVEEMRHYGVLKLLTEVHMPLAEELLVIEATGMAVDVPLMEEKKDEAEQEVARLAGGVKEAVAQRASVRREAHVAAHGDVVEQLEAERGAVGGRCEEHPDFTGATRRVACPVCKEIWQAHRTIKARHKKAIDQTKAKVKRFTQTPFDPYSDMDWRWLVYSPIKEGGLGLKSKMKTPKEKPSLNKDALRGLMALAGLAPEVHALLFARYRMGQLGSRISKYLNLPVAEDGRVHPAYAQHNVLNFRFSSGLDDTDEDKPNSPYSVNAQNFPEDCRDVICAPLGRCLVNFDLSAIEDWTTAIDVYKTVGSRAYWDLMMSGIDIHQMTADVISKRLPVPVTRKQGKTGRHGWKYGMREKKLAINRAGEGITFEMAREIIRTLDALHPDIIEWQQAKTKAVSRRPTLRNAFGHICHFTLTRSRGSGGVEPDEPNEVIAWTPASEAHDIAKRIWLRFAARRKSGQWADVKLINHAHDSFLFEIGDEQWRRIALVSEVTAIMEAPVDLMQTPDGTAFTPKVNVTWGYNWREHDKDNERGLRAWQRT